MCLSYYPSIYSPINLSIHLHIHPIPGLISVLLLFYHPVPVSPHFPLSGISQGPVLSLFPYPKKGISDIQSFKNKCTIIDVLSDHPFVNGHYIQKNIYTYLFLLKKKLKINQKTKDLSN